MLGFCSTPWSTQLHNEGHEQYLPVRMILLIAMIGAIVLTFRQRENVKKQSYIKQISRERSEGVEVIEVASNKGVKIDD